MKRIVYFLSFIVLALYSCEEVPPFIDFSIPVKPLKDTAYISSSVASPQHKAVLIEDITGVRCNNCPSAAMQAANIVNAKTEDSVVVMALYSGEYNTFFTSPWPNFPVLNSEYSGQLINLLGIPNALPNGYVDRAIYGSQTKRYNAYTLWGTLVNERLALTTPVNISMEESINDRIVNVKLKLEYTEDVSATHKYAIFLTESGIVSKQTTLTSYDDNYIHNHVLRYAVGNATGNPLAASLVKGRVFEKEYNIDVPAEYVMDKCHLVCVVTDANTEEVVNVRQINLH